MDSFPGVYLIPKIPFASVSTLEKYAQTNLKKTVMMRPWVFRF